MRSCNKRQFFDMDMVKHWKSIDDDSVRKELEGLNTYQIGEALSKTKGVAMFSTIIDFFKIRDNRFKNETNKTKNLLNMEQCHCPLSFKIACLIFSFKLLMLFPIWFKHSLWYYIFVSFYFSFASITFFTLENLAILVTCYLWSPSGSLQVG